MISAQAQEVNQALANLSPEEQLGKLKALIQKLESKAGKLLTLKDQKELQILGLKIGDSLETTIEKSLATINIYLQALGKPTITAIQSEQKIPQSTRQREAMQWGFGPQSYPKRGLWLEETFKRAEQEAAAPAAAASTQRPR